MKNIQKLLLLLLTISIFWSCEDDIYPELEEAGPQIVIDAWVNNMPEPQYIRISETLPYFDSLTNSGIANATVYILDNNSGTRYDFTETTTGIYMWTPSAQYPGIGMIGNSYNLFVEVGGMAYTSTSIMNRVPDIDSISFYYEDESIYPEGYYAQFYADDIPGPGDTYWIKAYKNGYFLNKPSEINLAYDAGFGAGSNIDGITFMEFIREMINPWEDDENGDELPPYHPGDSVYVEIHSINHEAHTYLTQMQIQINRPGGFGELFSVPLANVPTNILSDGAEENPAIGFFNMSAVSSMGGWLDPDNLPASNF